MLRMIEDEKLRPGDRIPSERDLADVLGLSRQTVRRALEDLVREGTLERRSTSGTHVATSRPFVRHVGTRRSGSIYRAVLRGGHAPSLRLLFFEQIAASRVVAAHLRLPPRAPLIVIRRLLSVDGVPVCIETSHLPAERVPGLVAADILEAGSLYELLQARYGLEFGDREATISAEVVLPRDAELLGLEPGMSVLVYRVDVADPDGRPIEHTISINHPTRVMFSTSLAPG